MNVELAPRHDEPIQLADLDAFDLRTEIAHGLSLSDGLRVDVIDENTLMVIGTDMMPTRGVYLATGRALTLYRHDSVWYSGRVSFWNIASPRIFPIDSAADLDDDLAWVRRRSDP